MNVNGRTDFDKLAQMFGLPTSEDVLEWENSEYWGENYRQTKRDALSNGETEDDAEEMARGAADAATDELAEDQYRENYDAVMFVVEEFFEEYNLSLAPVDSAAPVRGKKIDTSIDGVRTPRRKTRR